MPPATAASSSARPSPRDGPGALTTLLGVLATSTCFFQPSRPAGAAWVSEIVVAVLFGCAGALLIWTVKRLRRCERRTSAGAPAEVDDSELRLRTMLRAVPSLIFEGDGAGNNVFASETWCRFTGLTPEETAGRGWASALHPDDAVHVEARWSEALRAGAGVESRHRIRARDGSFRWFLLRAEPARDAQGRVARWAGSLTDIDDLVRAEEALRETHRELMSTLETMSDGFVALDRDWRYSYVNPAAGRILGRAPDELVGRCVWEAFPEVAESETRVRFERCVRTHVPEQFESRSAASGRWYENRCQPTPTGLAVFFNDITDRKVADTRLREAKTEAEEANRAKDDFLARLSHELRTPLTPVMAKVGMLLRGDDLDPRLRAALEMILRNVEMEARLVDDLLDLSRIARGKVEIDLRVVDLCDVVRLAVDVCMPDLAARGVRFAADWGPARACVVEADAARLQQVFWNLLRNAAKFTPPGGEVTVRCRREGGDAVAEVTDTGVGIAPASLSRIFNAFEQSGRSVTRRFGGLGLGLAISKALVELHHGAIRAFSEGEGRGATFTVALPALSGAPLSSDRESAAAPAPVPAAPRRALSILLVEDDADTSEILRECLQVAGHLVETAADVRAALSLSDARDFDVLVSDLGLPDGNGIDLLRELRERGKAMHAIAVSGYGREEDVRHSKEAGFMAHVTKPIHLERLEQVIASLR